MKTKLFVMDAGSACTLGAEKDAFDQDRGILGSNTDFQSFEQVTKVGVKCLVELFAASPVRKAAAELRVLPRADPC